MSDSKEAYPEHGTVAKCIVAVAHYSGAPMVIRESSNWVLEYHLDHDPGPQIGWFHETRSMLPRHNNIAQCLRCGALVLLNPLKPEEQQPMNQSDTTPTPADPNSKEASDGQ